MSSEQIVAVNLQPLFDAFHAYQYSGACGKKEWADLRREVERLVAESKKPAANGNSSA